MKFSPFRGILLKVAFSVSYAGAAFADMATVGSVGIVDTADISKIVTDGTSVTLSFVEPGAQEATIRYNVILDPPEDPGSGSIHWTLKVRYQDGDPPTAETQRLLVQLKQLELSSGQVTTVLTFDSNVTLITEDDWKLRTVCAEHEYRADSAYFLEAVLSSDATPIAPLVHLGGMVVSVARGGEFGCP